MGASELVLRQARPADAPRIHELHTASVRELCSPYYLPETIDGWLLNRRPDGYLPGIERGQMFVVERDGNIVGFGEATAGEVLGAFVDPAAVRAGIGSIIVQRALEMARREHQGPIRLESTLNATTFYERFGFREVTRSTVRRNRVEVPVVVMELR
jgi:GNAT superfamily N-acetyltransferase